MSRIAVVGGGISGMAAAYFLSRRHEVTLFERESRLGGHTHTVTASSSNGPVAVDIGFIVHNRVTYPNFCRLLETLGIETQPSDMSFGVSNAKTGFEYSSRGAAGFFAQPANLLRPGHYRLLMDILRFNREAPHWIGDHTLGQALQNGGYSREFARHYLYPMASAVWSTPPSQMRDFPVATLVAFFRNHGLFAVKDHPQWYTLRGGSQTYIPKLTAPYAERIRLAAKITAIRRSSEAVTLSLPEGELTFDEVVFACHGDQVLPLLQDATPEERQVFGHFRTVRNQVCLHTDAQLLPRRPAARASWNYLVGDEDRVTLTYHMNRLQSLRTPEEFCVTLNSNASIAKNAVVLQTQFEHPIYNREAVQAQARWSECSGRNRTHYCGAYWFYGFHEDGVRSALRVADALGCAA